MNKVLSLNLNYQTIQHALCEQYYRVSTFFSMYHDEPMDTFVRSLITGSVILVIGMILLWLWKACYQCVMEDSVEQQKQLVQYMKTMVVQQQQLLVIKAQGLPQRTTTAAATESAPPPRSTPERDTPRIHAVVDQIQLELHPLLSLPPPQ
jgi:hypothetical protein